MAKTGDQQTLGTAEGAVMGRAAHALHADSPVLDDTWAIQLLDAATQALVRDPEFAARASEPGELDTRPFFALNVGSLRYAEEEVERCVEDGIDQYVILGAGFDTFALRRSDLSGVLQVFEVDYPDVQALKRERIANASATPVAMPTFVPVDFESMSLREGLMATAFDLQRRAVFSWMNTLPYLSPSAVRTTLHEIAGSAAPGSRLTLNYACDVPFNEEQQEFLKVLQHSVRQAREPLQSRWKPEAFEELLTQSGFAIVEHATEQDLQARYFDGRTDGLKSAFPARLIVAESR